MADYDVAKAFKRIEDELISSMIANLKHHRAEETKEGIQWTQWQTEQLKALEIYKKQNKDKFSEKFTEINSNIESAIQKAYETGGMEQEIKILKAIQKGYKGYVRVFKGTFATDGNFFKVNERKLNALIESTVNDMQKAEHAVLRRTEDQYRKIIFDAQVYANSGGVTYEKAVDMATHDFLSAGIRCIEYKNGARHTISDYADMAIKTATKRAYLRGEGTKRNEWGISTVIVNKRSNPCPLCLPFVAKILIDDVYSGGSSADGDYPLLSTAMEMGFLHPRCKDIFTTYFEGISTPPKEQQLTQADLLKIKEQNELEKKKRFAENQQKRMNRLAKHSLDKDNKKIYSSRADEWQKKSEEISEKLNKSVEKSTEDKEHLTNVGATEEYNKMKAMRNDADRQARIKARRETYRQRHSAPTQAKPDFSNMDSKQLLSFVADNLKTPFINTKGVNTDFLRESVRVFYEFENKMSGKALDGLKVSFGAKRQTAYASYSAKTNEIYLKKSGSLAKFAEMQQSENARALKKAGKRQHVTTDFAGTIWHEIGHAIDHDTGQNMSRSLSATKDLEVKSVKISRYAGSDPALGAPKRSEAWAENFAAYMSGENANEVPAEIVKMIEDYFKKKK